MGGLMLVKHKYFRIFGVQEELTQVFIGDKPRREDMFATCQDCMQYSREKFFIYAANLKTPGGSVMGKFTERFVCPECNKKNFHKRKGDE